MKTKFLVIAITLLIAATSCSYFNEKDIEVTNERLSVTQSTSFVKGTKLKNLVGVLVGVRPHLSVAASY